MRAARSRRPRRHSPQPVPSPLHCLTFPTQVTTSHRGTELLPITGSMSPLCYLESVTSRSAAPSYVSTTRCCGCAAPNRPHLGPIAPISTLHWWHTAPCVPLALCTGPEVLATCHGLRALLARPVEVIVHCGLHVSGELFALFARHVGMVARAFWPHGHVAMGIGPRATHQCAHLCERRL
jgi:hypothetical protein